jgi:VanZ family protein
LHGLVVWALAASGLLLSPGAGATGPASFDAWDKVGHALLFLPAGYLGSMAPVLAFGGMAGFGGLTELAQQFVPGRSPEVLDLLADLVGGTFGLALGWWRTGWRVEPS